jgi:hypothetical protein
MADATTLRHFHLKWMAIHLPDMEEKVCGYLIKKTESWQY